MSLLFILFWLGLAILIKIAMTSPVDRNSNTIQTQLDYEENHSGSQISVTQRLAQDPTGGNFTSLEEVGDCVDVVNSEGATLININSNSRPAYYFKLEEYSSACEAISDSEEPLQIRSFSRNGSELILNERIPFGSFKLVDNPTSSVTFVFKSITGDIRNDFSVKDISNNLCQTDFASAAPYAKFSSSVNVLVAGTGAISRQLFQVFEDVECDPDADTQIHNHYLQSGTDLVNLTLKTRKVKSFKIIQVD